jgi:predicted alpha/beta-hydrolase family hydrolase
MLRAVCCGDMSVEIAAFTIRPPSSQGRVDWIGHKMTGVYSTMTDDIDSHGLAEFGRRVQSPTPAGARLIDGPPDARCRLLLAHGAGQGPDSAFMTAVARGLASAGLCVVRFPFPYMVRSEAEGRRRPPDREPILIETWLQVIAEHRGAAQRLLIGGKSMGGRIASLIADEAGVDGLACLGYPFHPPGRPERMRVEHLSRLRTPTLICQGVRDPFGSREEVAGYALSPSIEMVWIPDGEHSFKPRKGSGRTWEQNLGAAADALAAFAERLESRRDTRLELPRADGAAKTDPE